MKKGNIEGREPKSGRRIKGVGVLTVSVVLFMLVSLIMPTVSAAPAPDLFVDPMDLTVGPEPLVEGVPATVSFVVWNMGDQGAFSLNISLYDHGERVADEWFRDCVIGANITDTLPWTPQAAGTYDLTIRAWYGPGSTKTDQNWDDNNGSVSVTVMSRPDVYLTSSDITHTAPDPDYVVDGDLVTVRAVLHNAGTAGVTSCNVTLWEAAVGGRGVRVATLAAITIPGSGQVPVNLPWNTTGFSGKRNMYVHVTDVQPTETAFANNVATISIKVHTQEDEVFDGVDKPIRSPFKIQFFITVKGGGTLTITDTGNATVYQDYGEQYEIEVMGTGSKLIIDGGILNAAMNYTVLLTDSAELHLLNGAESNVRVVASGNAKVFIEDSTLDAPTIEMTGCAFTASGSTISAGRLDLFHTTVVVDSSSIRTGETIRIVGQTASFNDTEIKVVREFEDIVQAVETFPQLEGHDPDTKEVERLPPALVATSGAKVDLRNASIESTIYITSEESSYWTSNRLDAEGRTSVVNVHRYVVVQVRDWFGEVVPNAEVQVMDYFDDIVITSGTTNTTGDVTLAVKTDYVTAAQKPYVGNLRVRASAHGRTSDDVWFAHSKYPDMDFESNTMFVDIEMPPNPYPDMGLRYVRYVSPHTISGDQSGMDKNIIVDNTELTLVNTTFTLEQEFPYQWYILITGEHGILRLQNATIMSQYPFKIYVEVSGTLAMSERSALLDVRVIGKDDSSLEIVDGIITGGIFTECQSIEIAGASHLTLSHTHMEATIVSITGGYVHEQADMLIKANDVMLSGVELSADYEVSDTYGEMDLWEITLYFGWSILNEEEYLTNISEGYFDYFAAESEITIETSRLTIIDSFVYAIDTNIKVRRSASTPRQTSIEGSWIGGINLTVISDDMVAIDSHFNRVLDNFSGTDKIRLESVEVPGIICEGEARVERYWALTVYAYDGAGSVRPQALLEVFSTETNDRVFPTSAEVGLDSSRTNSAGMISVSLLANVTDSTGDYFVGSYYFWLVYDGPNFEDDPAYTETKQVNLKGDSVFEARWPIVIAPLEKEIIFCLYNEEEAGPSVDIKMYNHTFGSEEEAERFLNESAYMSYDRIKFNRTIIRNTTLRMTFYASARVNEVWEPLMEGTVKVYVLTTPDPNPNRPATDYNGTALIYTMVPDQYGMGNITISIPNGVGVYQLYIAIAGGPYDPIFEPIIERFMDLEVKHPQTIQITSAKIQEYPIHVGDGITIMGSVRYIYTDDPVRYAEIEITGTYVTPGRGLTNMDGGFTISMQAPLQPQENVSLEIIAVDPTSDEQSAIIINYAVEPPYEAEDVKEFPWGWVIIGIIAAVIAFSIVLGAVMMYRKHYGEVVECGECGAFIPSSATSCPKCGIEFETDLARCSECEAWIPAKSSSCPVCATPFTIQSLEDAVAMEEADEDVAPIDQLTTSTAQLAPLTLDGATQASKWGDKVEKRRRRIKKRVKKRLTVTDAEGNLEEMAPEEAKDLFVGEEGDEATRLPGLGVDESMLSDDELSRLLPTEDMLKELMLTSDQAPIEDTLEGEADELADEEAPEADEADVDADADADAMEAGMDLEEIPSEEGEAPEPDAEGLEEIPPPEEADDDLDLPEDEETMPDLGQIPDEDVSEGRELLSELGLVAEVPSGADRHEGEVPAEEESLKDLLTEDESKETPKLCPNCGGNWILYKDGEYTCRICGEKW